MPKYPIATLLSAAVIGLSPVQANAIEVVSTLKPINLLVSEITEGVLEPTLLLPANASPHDFQLKPSQRRTIQEADVIFWIGPDMEMALNKPLGQLDDHTLLVTLSEGALDEDHDKHEAHDEHEDHKDHDEHDEHKDHDAHKEHDEHKDHDDHKDHDEHENHDDHHHHGVDLHLWLDPHEGERMAKLIAEKLSQADPDNSSKYEQNLNKFLTNLEELDDQLKQRLAPLSDKGYFVFHDAYNRFEAHYGLNHLGAITISPERRPGARHLAEIRERLTQNQAVCVFSEPQFPSSLVSNLVDGIDVASGILDPLGGRVESGSRGYLRFLEQMTNDFESCLK